MATAISARAEIPVLFRIASYAVLAFFSVFTLAPLIWLGYTALKPQSEIMANLAALPVRWTFENFAQAWSIADFPHLFVNSLIYSVTTTAGVVTLAMAAGFAFAKIPSRYTRLWYAFILLGLLVTISSSIVPLFVAETLLGLTNRRLGIIIPYVAFNLSFAIYLASGYIRSLEQEIIEAAKIDGAGYLKMFWSIVLPMSRPIITTIAIFTFHACWVEYVLVYMLSSDDSIRTVQVGVRMLNGQLNFNYGFLFAAIVIATLPVLVLYMFFRRQLQAGFTGAVKG